MVIGLTMAVFFARTNTDVVEPTTAQTWRSRSIRCSVPVVPGADGRRSRRPRSPGSSAPSDGRATGALPTWLVWLTYIVGVVELVNVSIATPTVYVMPAWIALVSIVLLVRRPPHAFELEAAPEPRTR